MDRVISALKSDDLQFGLGTSQIASLGRRIPYKNSVNLFRTAFANGVNIIDTADSYGSGDSEYLIGKVLETLNATPFIITKAGFPYMSVPKLLSPLNQIGKRIKQKLGYKKNFNSDYIISSLNKSLKRLRKKQAGAFLLHDLNEDDIKNWDCWDTLAKVKETNLSALSGISSNNPMVVEKGIESGQIEIVETLVQYGNDNSMKIVGMCKENKIPVVANEVLGPFHSGTYNVNKITSESQALPELNDVSPMQLLIGITYAGMKVNCILLGTRDEQHLLQNIKGKNFFPAIEKNLTAIKKIFNDNRAA